MTGWDAETYAKSFSFVPAYGRELIDLLAPQKGEAILDLGCGTGALSAELAAHGAVITGVDADANMIALAKKTHPALSFFQQDGSALTVTGPFDAVFSNAALHWMDVSKVFPQVAKVLKQGGRFAAELGGVHNIAAIERAIYAGLAAIGIKASAAPAPWRFPTPATLAHELEKDGFEVRYMHLYDRPTPLGAETGGLRGWIKMFGSAYMARVPEAQHEAFLKHIEDHLRPVLWRDGQWIADYRRQHFVAFRL
jgi:trans-aconitate methyltransferase